MSNRNSANGVTSVAHVRRARNKRSTRSISKTGHAVGSYVDDAMSLASRTAQGLNALRKLVNVETKYVALSASSTGSQAGVVDYLLPHSQGTNVTDRIGDSIKLQRIVIRGNIKKGATDVTYRIMVVRDLQNTGSTPAGSDVITNAGTSGCTYSHTDFFNGPMSSNRFSILYDETFAMDAVVTPIVVFDIDLPHSGHVKYRGTGATSASAGAGALFLLHFSDSNTTPPTTNFQSFITYTDD